MRFSYIAQDKKENEVRGEVEAKSEKDAASFVVRQGLLPLKISPIGGSSLATAKKRKRRPIFLSSGLTTFDQIIITRHLGTILATGTDLLTGLEIIAEDAEKPSVKNILNDIRSRISAGETLSQALHAWAAHFDPVLLNLVKTGEVSGNLAQTILQYSQEMRKEYAFNRKVKGAMIYPVILLSALGVMLIIILSVVVPRLKELFTSTNVVPPLYTRMIFGLSDIWLQFYLPILIAVTLIGITVMFSFRDPRFKRLIANILWYLPYLRNIHKNYLLLRMCRILSRLITAGVPLEKSLAVTANALGGKYQATLVDIAEHRLAKGISLADSMRKERKLFPSILISVVATGEKSGQLDATLSQMAEFYEEEVMYALERFLVVIEPTMIVFVGLIIGLMAGSLIAPIYKFIGRF